MLALALLKNGIKVRIIDKDEGFHEGTRGAGLHVCYVSEIDEFRINTTFCATDPYG